MSDAMRQMLGLPVPAGNASMASGNSGNAAQPAPVAPPATGAPAPAEDPILKAMAERQEALEGTVRELNEGLGALTAVLNQQRTQAPKPPMPSDEELNELPRAQATRVVAEHLLDDKLGVFAEEVRGVLRGIGGDVLSMKRQNDETSVRAAYPALDFDRYKQKYESLRRASPNLSALEAIRAVADPADLTGAPPATTRTPHDGAAHVETGLSAASTRHTPSPAGREPSRPELIAAVQELRRLGRNRDADSMLLRLVSMTPNVPAVRPGVIAGR